MQFLSELRDPIRRGEITCSVRLWQSSHVKVAGRYSLPPGHVVVTAVREMSLEDITPALAGRSGFAGVVDLLKIARHGPGRRVFLIEFRYEAPGKPPAELRANARLKRTRSAPRRSLPARKPSGRIGRKNGRTDGSAGPR
jgi:hypothetical protein